MMTVGRPMISTASWTDAVWWSASVAETVIVWTPRESALVVRVAPVPRTPSRLEVQVRRLERSPSSKSNAIAEKVIGSPKPATVRSGGPRMTICGPEAMFRWICALPVRLPLFVAAAVMVCRPSESDFVLRLAPVPSAPSRSDVQRMAAPRSPSIVSLAVAVKAAVWAKRTSVLSAGAVMATVGAAWWRTSSVIWAMPARLARSVAEAVIVCTPIERLLVVKLAPVPIAPSRLEVQVIVDDRSPSIVSMAVAVKVIGFPSAKRVAVGAVIVTTGGASSRTVTCVVALAERPAVSVIDAVKVCVPRLSVARLKLPPVPIAPSRSEVHRMGGERSPSKLSVAVAPNGTGAPKANFLPLAGAASVRTGVETLATSMVIDALPVRLPASAARAVMVWWPRLRFERLNEPPVPIWPSRFEVQIMFAVRSPSIESMAVPVKVAGWPGRNLSPRFGDVIVTTGGASASTVSVICALPVSLALSVADAVMVCRPAERLEVLRVVPAPMLPSRLDVHLIDVLITPSVPLVAVPVKVTAEPARTLVFVVGEAMVTTGTGFGYSIQPCQYLSVSLVEAMTRMPLLGSSTCVVALTLLMPPGRPTEGLTGCVPLTMSGVPTLGQVEASAARSAAL